MKHLPIALALLALLAGCKTSKDTGSDALNDTVETVELPEVEITPPTRPLYRPSATRTHDLIHTELEVEPVWETESLLGQAWLTLAPYFYPTDQLVLDAKGFDVHRVAMVTDDTVQTALDHRYDGLQLFIDLGRTYDRDEEYTVYIDYTAKPNELELGTSNEAISGDRGLYFIDPMETDPNRPTQLWTQGEPEASSCWFPTIDKPNERCTQELRMIVRDDFITISNGLRTTQEDMGKGFRMDTWVQEKPHAPYLFMMAAGQWHEEVDEWNGLSVNYYVDHEYADVAMQLFGNTPEMMTFYSDLFQVEYPWSKYWQVCVTDFVSGAMENTTAVIHGDFVQRTERELLDGDYEDIVAHELVHHWFGDLVTCESWANIPLNESFATYGEVLWKDEKYGDEEGLLKRLQDETSYFREARSKQVDLIRFKHDVPNDMFDRHSYEKGSCVLHMLRAEIGDAAFFESLGLYLREHEYEPVEIHQLRLAAEEVTGRDLNWFFNQWFLDKGHPILEVEYTVRRDSAFMTVSQRHSADEDLVYRLPMTVRMHTKEGMRDERVELTEASTTFGFATADSVVALEFDPDHTLLADVAETKPEPMWRHQFRGADDFLDKEEALDALAELEADMDRELETALTDDFWHVREAAVNWMAEEPTSTGLTILQDLALNDDKTEVRAAALEALGATGEPGYAKLMQSGLESPSYRVIGASLIGLSDLEPQAALDATADLEDETNIDVLDAVGTVYAAHGDASHKAFFEEGIRTAPEDYMRYYHVYFYSQLLGRLDADDVLPSLQRIEEYGTTDEGEYADRVAISALTRIQTAFGERSDEVKKEMDEAETDADKLELEQQLTDQIFVVERCTEALTRLMGEE